MGSLADQNSRSPRLKFPKLPMLAKVNENLY